MLRNKEEIKYIDSDVIAQDFLSNENLLIVGRSGSGKKVIEMNLAAKLLERGEHILVIAEEGEYDKFSKHFKGKTYNLTEGDAPDYSNKLTIIELNKLKIDEGINPVKAKDYKKVIEGFLNSKSDKIKRIILGQADMLVHFAFEEFKGLISMICNTKKASVIMSLHRLIFTKDNNKRDELLKKFHKSILLNCGYHELSKDSIQEIYPMDKKYKLYLMNARVGEGLYFSKDNQIEIFKECVSQNNMF